MADDSDPIVAKNFKQSVTKATHDLHITGGVRAGWAGDHLWRWFPTFTDGRVGRLQPLPIQVVDQLATDLGAKLFGSDNISNLDGPMISRVWRPLDGPDGGGLMASDKWRLIYAQAEKNGNTKYAGFAANLAFSLTATGIRLRDASDHYHDQLLAALHEHRKAGERFANIPMKDLQLAFHSILSELGSARDYLAAAIAHQFNAPDRIDGLNRFADWVGAASRSNIRADPLVAQMLQAYDPASPDPWLWDISEYRNLFLHRKPFGAPSATRWLRYEETERRGILYPRIELPLPDDDHSAPGVDALNRFVALYRKMVSLLDVAAGRAPYEARMETIVIE